MVAMIVLAILALLGLLLMTAGAGVAGVVGSDDTVFNRPAELGPDGRPVLTSPGLLAYDGVTITLRASAPGGVFIGTAHPVDVSDFVAESSRIRLTRVTRDGVRSEDIGSAEPVRPASVDFWTHSMTGQGVEELTLEGDAEAAQWVIAPISGQGPTTVSFGVTVPGLFRQALIAFGLGALLLVVSVELLIRTRRRGPPVSAASPTSHRGRRKAPRTRRRRSVSLMLALSLPLSLTGCRWDDLLPAQPHAEELAATKVALTRAELPALLTSYDDRLRRAAQAAKAPGYRSDSWRLVDRGPALESDLFETRVAKLTGLGVALPSSHQPVGVYSARFTSYPMWTIVASRSGGDERLDLFTKASVQAPWLRQAGTTVSLDLPEAARPSRVPDNDKVAAATAAWQDYLRSGTSPDGLEVDRDSKVWRDNVTDLGGRAMFRGVNVVVQPAGKSGLSRIVEVEDGELAIVALRVTTRLAGRGDLQVEWNPPYGKYRPSKDGVLSFADLAVGVIYLPTKGPATLLGSSFSEVAVTP